MDPTNKGVFKCSLLKGYKMAKKRSNVTESVIKTDPTLPMWAMPYLKFIEIRYINFKYWNTVGTSDDWSVNSRLWKIHARKQYLAFHGITFHLSSKLLNPIHANSRNLSDITEYNRKLCQFLKTRRKGKFVIHRFHGSGKWWNVKLRSCLIHVNFAHNWQLIGTFQILK